MHKMIEEGTRYIAAGKYGFASGQGILRTVVGPGLALLVHCENYQCGGMLHLFGYRNRADDAETVLNDLRSTMDVFFYELSQHRRLSSDCRLELVGGSQMITIGNPTVRNEFTQKKIDLATEYARKQQMNIGRIVVGGTAARSVIMDFSASRIVINRVESTVGRTAGEGSASSSATGETPPPARPFNVGTGKMIVDRSPTMLVAILGSCVGVALYDASTGIGGLAHVMTPDSPPNAMESSMYADTAVPALIRAMVELGADRDSIRAKIAGGANVLMVGNHETRFRIGERNTENVLKSLSAHRIPLLSNETGGRKGRKMFVNLRNFDVQAKDIITETIKR